MPGHAHDSAELQQLADALNRQGYHATIITPAPYLALHIPGATLPYMIYNSDGNYWWHTPQDIAPSSQTTRAAELIIWGLRNLAPELTTSHTGRGSDQTC